MPRFSRHLTAAKDACALVRQVKAAPPDACARIEALSAQLATREQAEQAQQDRVSAAQEDRFDRCSDACEERHPDYFELCMQKCCAGGAGCPKENGGN
jgi:hypothetical protein